MTIWSLSRALLAVGLVLAISEPAFAQAPEVGIEAPSEPPEGGRNGDEPGGSDEAPPPSQDEVAPQQDGPPQDGPPQDDAYAASDTRVVIAIADRGEATAAALMLDAPGLHAIPAPPPTGDTSLLRAGAAQDLAREHDAGYTIWVEKNERTTLVRVVRATGLEVLETSLRDLPEENWARFVSLASASLIEELARTPEREGAVWIGEPPQGRPPAPRRRPRVVSVGVEPPRPRGYWFMRAGPLLLRVPRVDLFAGGSSTQKGTIGGGLELMTGKFLTDAFRLDVLVSIGYVGNNGMDIGLAPEIMYVTSSFVRFGIGVALRATISEENYQVGRFSTAREWYLGLGIGGVLELALDFGRTAAVSRLEVFLARNGNPDIASAPGMAFSLGWEWH